VQSSSSHSTGAAFVRSLLNGSCLPAESNICAAQPFALSIAADCAHPRPSSCSERRKTLDCSNGSLGELDHSHQNSMLALKLANLWIDHDASLLDDIYLVSAMYFLEVHLFESVCPFTETVQRLVWRGNVDTHSLLETMTSLDCLMQLHTERSAVVTGIEASNGLLTLQNFLVYKKHIEVTAAAR
jgi:hypothetical protein